MFLAAAVGKSANPSEFLSAIVYLAAPASPLSEPAARGIVACVIAWEALLGVHLLLGRPHRWVIVSSLVTLLAFTGALVRLGLEHGAPSCGCLGWLDRVHGGGWVVRFTRNLGLLWILVLLLVAACSRDRDVQRESALDHGARRGFTLIEMLIVIVVVAVLMAISLPAIGAARKRGAAVRSLSTQKQLLASLSMYAQDASDFYPFMGVVGDPFGPITVNGKNVAIQGFFPDQSYCWASLILPDYFDAPASTIEAASEPNEHGIVRSYYILTQTVFADPAAFAADQVSRPEHCRGVRVSDVAAPSRKGLIVDITRGVFTAEMATDAMSYYVGGADGSAAIRPAAIIDAFPSVLPNYSNTSTPILTTKDGVRGLDY